MAITSTNDIAAGLAAADAQTFLINKGSFAGTVASVYSSYWRAGSVPAVGTIPTTPAICDKTTVGGWNFNSPDTANGKKLYIAGGKIIQGASGATVEIHDRLVHMGGLNSTLLTAQTVNLDVSSTSSNLQERIGPSDLSQVMWWMEWYVSTGATIATVNVSVTYTDLSTGTISITLPASVANNRIYRVLPTNGKIIKQIDTATFSVSTGAAGNVGFTATRELISMETTVANWMRKYNWMDLELTPIPDYACIVLNVLPTTTSSGSAIGNLRIIHR